ncbi:thioesterase family protein [Pseudomonas saudimassiliensis]|uniref:Thioesterase family protein n=1 Tax=Pseudomonas saudimassiliensis TaxID=1461581 RepID=A0A078MI57_9PSED|nr:PaaI family thioesterase [Pseudomonas saudimassiliensis]CEA04386.1 thioesterase family protein [Pseudomonas saudimassiliensis]CEF26582.1 thioesterase family protein [Pseudomonas saudimassiliensis]
MSEDQNLAVQRTVTGFFQELGGELLEYSANRAVVGLTLEKRHLNNASNLHGGITASLLDIAMGLCGTYAENPDERRVAITLSMNVNFSATADEGARVRAVATCRKNGHKIFMASCDLLDENDNLLAFGEGVFKKGALRRDLP